MTERSYVWPYNLGDGVTYNPYNAEEWGKWMFLHQYVDSTGYVVPGYLNDLEVVSSSVAGISVRPGAAFCKNKLFILDSEVPLPVAFGTNDRLDAVVLRYTASDNEIRLAVINSASYSVGVAPVLQQDETVWEVPLAYILYVADSDTIESIDIYDTRKFIRNPVYEVIPTNLVTNGEFVMWSVTPGAPEYWEGYLDTSGASRGAWSSTLARLKTRGFRVLSDTNMLAQTLPYKASYGKVFTVSVASYNSGFIAGQNVSGAVRLEAYNVVGELLETKVQRVGFLPYEVTTFTCEFESDNIDYLKVILGSTLAEKAYGAYYLNIAVCPGYFAGYSRQFHDVLFFNTFQDDASWGSVGFPDAKSTGVTTIDFTASFGGCVTRIVRAVILKVTINDSGSAAGSGIGFGVGPVTPASNPAQKQWLILDGVPNDFTRTALFIVNTYADTKDGTDEEPECEFEVSASGAGTLDIIVELVGIIT